MTLFRKVWRFCSAGMRCNWWQVFFDFRAYIRKWIEFCSFSALEKHRTFCQRHIAPVLRTEHESSPKKNCHSGSLRPVRRRFEPHFLRFCELQCAGGIPLKATFRQREGKPQSSWDLGGHPEARVFSEQQLRPDIFGGSVSIFAGCNNNI